MTLLKNLALMVLVVVLGSAAGLLGTRWMMDSDSRPDTEALDALPVQLAGASQPVLFTLSTCPACRQLKKWMGENSIGYVEYSIDTDDSARALAEELDIDSVPVVFTETLRINGFHAATLSEHLKPTTGG